MKTFIIWSRTYGNQAIVAKNVKEAKKAFCKYFELKRMPSGSVTRVEA